MRYHEDYKDIDDVRSDFSISKASLKDREVLYARGMIDSYEGTARVLFQRDGKLFEVDSSHCSCNGHDWSPQEVTWEQLAMRPNLDPPLAALVRRHVPRA